MDLKSRTDNDRPLCFKIIFICVEIYVKKKIKKKSGAEQIILGLVNSWIEQISGKFVYNK